MKREGRERKREQKQREITRDPETPRFLGNCAVVLDGRMTANGRFKNGRMGIESPIESPTESPIGASFEPRGSNKTIFRLAKWFNGV